MLFPYTYVPHQMEKMQTFIDFIFHEVWCEAPTSGPFGLNLFDANGIVHVSAKDKATGKEQKIKIEAGTGSLAKVPMSQAGRVQDLMRVIGEKADVASPVKQLLGKLDDIGEIPSVPKPRSLKANLRPYQKEGFHWLAFIHELAHARAWRGLEAGPCR